MMTVTTGKTKVNTMTKIMIEVDPDQMQMWVVNDLKQCYIDHATHWKKEPDYDMLSDALLTVIEHYSAPSEYNEWYETIKEL